MEGRMPNNMRNELEDAVSQGKECMKRGAFMATLVILVGCQSVSLQPDLRPALVQELGTRGVTDANTQRIIAVACEGDYGADVQVPITAPFLIQEIWDTIWQSRPYKTWAASGFRKLRFYKDRESGAPQAELLVNVTDRCHFDGAFDDGYRCPGINKILEPLLKKEYERIHR